MRWRLALIVGICILTGSCLPKIKPVVLPPLCGQEHPEWWDNRCLKKAQTP